MTGEDGLWMTYADAAAALRIKVASVKRRARARHWPRRETNGTLVQVLVPPDALADRPAAIPAALPPSPAPPSSEDHAARIAAAETRADGAERRAQEIAADRDRWRDMAESLRADLAAERARSVPRIEKPGVLARIFGRR